MTLFLQHFFAGIIISLLLTGLPTSAHARGGGGCFVAGTLVATPHGPVPIEDLRRGDPLLAFTGSGAVLPTVLRSVITHPVDEYRLIKTERAQLLVTPEHPFYLGAGTFKTVAVLQAGDVLHAYDGAVWSDERILSIDTVKQPAIVYDLQTDAPHTFFANEIAVHNKGGGGGCFPAGTMVRTPSGVVPIEKLVAGDLVIAVDAEGQQTTARVQEAYATASQLVRITTRHGNLTTTDEHPLLLFNGEFLEAGDILSGERVMLLRHGFLKRSVVLNTLTLEGKEPVYNLMVDGTHTFIADDFVVHNKGGGGFGGSGYHGSDGGRPMSNEEFKWFIIMIGGSLVFGFVYVTFEDHIKKVFPSLKLPRGENLDQLYSRGDIEKKSVKTLKLLQFLTQQDPSVNPEALDKRVREVFSLLQKCWQARDYGAMKPLLMPDLYADHLRQIDSMQRNHEINIIEGLHIDAVDLVNVRYSLNRIEREFTALITATAQDYYIDDRTKEKRRGDNAPAQFQEFWTFHFHDGAWLLREIEQAAESEILKDENYFEQFTDKAVDQVYGETASAEGPAGPWTEGESLAKQQRIERLLAHLALTDKLWTRDRMLQTARSVFIAVTGNWESGIFEEGLRERLYPELAQHLASTIEKNTKAGITMEFRNLAVRKVELVLVKNFADNRNDEFVVRVRAHAQKALKEHGMVVRQDTDVMAFEEYLTFGRLDNDWKLKEIIATAEGKELRSVENVDENSSPRMLEWYYQHKRPT